MQGRVEVPPDQIDVAEQLAQSLQRVVLALDRMRTSWPATRALTVSRPSEGGQSMRM